VDAAHGSAGIASRLCLWPDSLLVLDETQLLLQLLVLLLQLLLCESHLVNIPMCFP
jgi:hypothetical protein